MPNGEQPRFGMTAEEWEKLVGRTGWTLPSPTPQPAWGGAGEVTPSTGPTTWWEQWWQRQTQPWQQIAGAAKKGYQEWDPFGVSKMVYPWGMTPEQVAGYPWQQPTPPAPTAEAPSALPPNWPTMTTEQQHRWMQANAVDIAIQYPRVGYPSRDPNQETVIIYIMPDGSEIEVTLPLGEAQERMAEFQKAKAVPQPTGFTEYGEKMAEYDRQKAEILARDITYDEKLRALLDLHTSIYGYQTDVDYSRITTEAYESMPPEQQQEIYQWGYFRGRPEPFEMPAAEEKPPETVDIAELTRLVTPFGITVMPDYPYLSPISEAHLRRLPQPTLEMMSRYLTEKGLDWRDWLALSEGFYGGMTTPAVRWGTARQWG